MTPVPGIDVETVTAWITAADPEVEPPLAFTLIEGGRSNLTYRVTDSAGRAFVLRRPPLGHLLASAHDMGREHRIMAALAGSTVPVPPLVGYCSDETVNGTPFYVMRFVDGLVLRNADALEAVDEEVRGGAAFALVDTLADLHATDPAAVGLRDLGRPDGYVERLLRRWSGQWEQSKTRELALVGEVAARLAARIPPAGPTRIVHGDYRLDNVIVAPDTGAVRAVLDWELCTLGDPLADVGLLSVYWTEPTDLLRPLEWAPTACGGFPGRAEILARYEKASGADLSDVDFYVALGYWKVAVILEGVFARYSAGAYGGGSHDAGSDDWHRFGEIVPLLAEAASEAAARSGR